MSFATVKGGSSASSYEGHTNDAPLFVAYAEFHPLSNQNPETRVIAGVRVGSSASSPSTKPFPLPPVPNSTGELENISLDDARRKRGPSLTAEDRTQPCGEDRGATFVNAGTPIKERDLDPNEPPPLKLTPVGFWLSVSVQFSYL